jgi:hypothetical protein
LRNLVALSLIVRPLSKYADLLGFLWDPEADSSEANLRSLTKYRSSLASAAFDVPPHLASAYLERLEEHPETLRAESILPISRWAEIADISPELVPNQFDILFGRLRDAGIRLHLVLDLSPTPIGRAYLDGNGGETLTESYIAALEIYAAEIVALRDRLGEGLDLTLILPDVASRYLPAQLSFEVGLDNDSFVREQTNVAPYDIGDFVEIVGARYPSHADSRVISEVANLANVNESVSLSTAAWLLGQRVADLPSMSSTKSLSWSQEDFDRAIRGLSQMIGLPVSGDNSGRRVVELFFAGLERALLPREEPQA